MRHHRIGVTKNAVIGKVHRIGLTPPISLPKPTAPLQQSQSHLGSIPPWLLRFTVLPRSLPASDGRDVPASSVSTKPAAKAVGCSMNEKALMGERQKFLTTGFRYTRFPAPTRTPESIEAA